MGRFYHAAKAEKTIQACALRLLRSWLSPEQRAEFDTRGYFDVVGCDSGKRYRIRQGTSGNFNELDEYGRLCTGWCFVPLGGLVEGDVMLAQKIALETDHARSKDSSGDGRGARFKRCQHFPGPIQWRLPGGRSSERRSLGACLYPS
nr:hypothetical protein [Bradyrhizobium vignae]